MKPATQNLRFMCLFLGLLFLLALILINQDWIRVGTEGMVRSPVPAWNAVRIATSTLPPEIHPKDGWWNHKPTPIPLERKAEVTSTKNPK